MDARVLLRPFVRLSAWRRLRVASLVCGVVSVLSYLLLASRAPAAALLVGSLAGFLAVLGGVFAASPAERKITVSRQAEVVGSRLLLVLVIYYGVGLALLWGLNQLSPHQARVPLTWDASFLAPWQTTFVRRVTFWPFYALVLVGCQGILPTPPGAC